MNQRRRTRVESHKSVTLTWEGGECRGEVVNVSLKGCLVGEYGEASPRVGEPVAVAIHLEKGAPDLDISVRGKAVRTDAAGIAVDFTEVPPESFPHLFRLVQYNAPDPDGIEEELVRSAFGSSGVAED